MDHNSSSLLLLSREATPSDRDGHPVAGMLLAGLEAGSLTIDDLGPKGWAALNDLWLAVIGESDDLLDDDEDVFVL